MLLAIDTSTRYGGVCLRDEQRVVASLSWYSSRNHTSELMPAVQQVLMQAGKDTKELSVVTVALGPGGFSALRVGISVAKGMAFSLGIPLVGVGTLEIEVFPYATMGWPACPILDIGRGGVASALYSLVEEKWQRVMDDQIQSLEALVEAISNRGYERVLFCGEGVESKGSLLREALGGMAVMPSQHNPVSRLWSLATVGWNRCTDGLTDNVATLQPHYLRLPTIGAPPKERLINR
jgi:tRNA threonylcarbamoyladenosine biosynthesis protein TsaB